MTQQAPGRRLSGQQPQGGYQGRPRGGYQGNREGAAIRATVPRGRLSGQPPRAATRATGPRAEATRATGPRAEATGARPQGWLSGPSGGDDKDARDNRGRNDSRRPAGTRDGKSSFDTPIQTKPTSNRQNKNSHKNDRFDKRDRLEDGKESAEDRQRSIYHAQPKKEESKADEVKTITLPMYSPSKELAEKMKLQPSVIVKKLFLKGQVVTLNQEIDYEQAEEIAMEFDVLCEKGSKG